MITHNILLTRFEGQKSSYSGWGPEGHEPWILCTGRGERDDSNIAHPSRVTISLHSPSAQ